MSAVRVSQHFGIVIQKRALQRFRLSLDDLLRLLEASEPFDEDELLLSFGPHFGGEASAEFIRRLEGEGLVYGDDFLDFEDTLPEWCQLMLSFKLDAPSQ